MWVPKLERVDGVEADGDGSVEGAGAGGDCEGCCEDVAMTRKVVRSKRMTSVAEHAVASLSRCFVRMEAFGMRVWTIWDHAYSRVEEEGSKKNTSV